MSFFMLQHAYVVHVAHFVFIFTRLQCSKIQQKIALLYFYAVSALRCNYQQRPSKLNINLINLLIQSSNYGFLLCFLFVKKSV